MSKSEVEKPPFRPTGMNVLIKIEDGETKSPGGILLPGAGKGRPVTAIVIACGPGEWTRKAFVRNPLLDHIGARVVFDAYTLKAVFGKDGLRNESSVFGAPGSYAVIDNDNIHALCDPNDRVHPGNA